MLGARVGIYANQAPDPLPFAYPYIWLDPSDYSTLNLNSINKVIGMRSKKGSIMFNASPYNTYLFSNTFTKGTSRNPPDLVVNSPAILGRNYLSFDGTQGLQSIVSDPLFTAGSRITIALVFNKTSNVLYTALGSIIANSDGQATMVTHVNLLNNNKVGLYRNSSMYAYSSFTATTLNTWHILMMDFGTNNNTVNIYLDGVQQSISYAGTFTHLLENYQVMLGCTNSGNVFTGYIAEFIMFKYEMSLSQRDAVYNYFTSKYGINAA